MIKPLRLLLTRKWFYFPFLLCSRHPRIHECIDGFIKSVELHFGRTIGTAPPSDRIESKVIGLNAFRLCSTTAASEVKPERPEQRGELPCDTLLARRRRSSRRIRPTALSSAYQLLFRSGDDDDEGDAGGGGGGGAGGTVSRPHRNNRSSQHGLLAESDEEFHPDTSVSDEEEDVDDGDEDFDVRAEQGGREAHANGTRVGGKRSRVRLLCLISFFLEMTWVW